MNNNLENKFSKTVLGKSEKKLKSSDFISNTISNFKPIFVKLIIISFFANILTLSIPIFIMIVYDKVIPSESLKILFQLTIGAVICIAATFLLQKVRIQILSYISAKVEKVLPRTIIEKILYLPPNLTENAPISSQVAKINEFSKIKQLLTSQIANTIVDIPYIILSVAIVAIIDIQLAILPILFFGVYLGLSLIFRKYIKKAQINYSKKNSELNTFLTEISFKKNIFSNLANSSQLKNKFNNILQDNQISEIKLGFWRNILSSISEALILTSGLCIASLGAIKVIEGNLTIGGLIAAMILTWKILGPIKNTFSLLPNLSDLKNTLNQINKFMKIEDENNNNLINLEEIKGEIHLDRIYFRYSPKLPGVAMGISFNVKPNTITCIYGTCGSGKSTLAKLLLKLQQPQSGTISIDNYNLQQIDPISLRQNIGYLPQHNQIISGTIFDNLKLNNPLAELNDIEHILKDLNLSKDISNLKYGINTIITEETINSLKPNFIQKLSIARVLVKNASLYILDEPTNNLDKDDVKHFDHLIKKLVREKGCTVIIFANDKAMSLNSNKTINLDTGDINWNDFSEEIINSKDLKRKRK